MAAKTKTWLVLSLLLLAANCMQHCVYAESQVPCLYIFGNSLSDSGNNNNLPTSAKFNYKPYGIDFPEGPTGRPTNGRLAIDIMSRYLGFQNFIPPFANTSGSDILKGVNYASSSAGIRFESGKQLGFNIYLGSQVENHKVIFLKIVAKLGGSNKAVEYLKKCLYYVNIGTNDYINNYFLNTYLTSKIYSPEQYAKDLIDKLSLDLQDLHLLGARKFALSGLGLLGCFPGQRNGTKGTCVEEKNANATIFDNKLKSLVDQLNTKFSTDSKFIFINKTTIDNSLRRGFRVSDVACCPTGASGQCVPNQIPCQNRNEYVYYDGVHTTDAANLIIAKASYNASNPAITYPMDIKHLVQS